MANVFLSYDHDDAARAAPIASALEKAGHSVWWDRHIDGGAEYYTEIENAVEAADAVVVLWSACSVRSAWVRDEAGEGRDQGKLIPILLDIVKPPMGFRQFQTIDLSAWKPGQRLPNEDKLLRAIQSTGRPSTDKIRPVTSLQSAAAAPHWRMHLPVRWIAAAAAALSLIGVLLAWNSLSSTETQAVAAVVPADPSAVSRDYARDLLAKLGKMQSGRGAAVELGGEESRKRADFTFEVGGSNDGKATHANLLLRSRSSAILWSGDFERPSAKAGDLRQQVGYTAAQVLDCAVEAHNAGLGPKSDTLSSYLQGCAQLALGTAENATDLVVIFRRVVAVAPKFAGGWSKLLLAELGVSLEGQQRRTLQKDIAEARKLDPHLSAAYIAEISLLPESAYAAAIGLADRAIAANPEDALLFETRAELLDGVGRTTEAVNDIRRAADLEPTSASLRTNLIMMLANAGRLQGAFKELDEAERLWPGSTDLYGTRYIINARYADARVAEKMGESGNFTPSWARSKNYWRARLDPTPANVEVIVKQMREVYATDPNVARGQFIHVLGTFHREPELLELLMKMPLNDAISYRSLLFRPTTTGFWRNPSSLTYAKRIGLLQYWQTSGHWPDFCSDRLPYDCKKEAGSL